MIIFHENVEICRNVNLDYINTFDSQYDDSTDNIAYSLPFRFVIWP